MARGAKKKAAAGGGEGGSPLVEVQQSYVGVRTRSRALAMQEKPEYLELRSRRLERPRMAAVAGRSSRRRRSVKVVEKEKEKENTPELEGAGDVVSVGENGVVELDDSGRSTGENIPSALIVAAAAGDSTPPGSVTEQTAPAYAATRGNTRRMSPSEQEVEEFFGKMEQSFQEEQRVFMEKYNFDVVNDVPLPAGRYEWEKILP